MNEGKGNGSASGDGEQALFVLFLLALGMIVVSVYGLVLSLAAACGGFVGCLQWSVLRRMTGEPFSGPEVLAAFVTAIVAIGSVAGLLMLFVWMGRRAEKKIFHQRFASGLGTARWGRRGDVADFLGNDGILLGRNGRAHVRLNAGASCGHVAVIGPTGAGKSSCVFIPNLLTLPDGWSAIVTDPKGEIASITEPALQRRGWKTVRIGFLPGCVPINPLELAQSDAEVSELAEVVLRNGFSAAGEASDPQWVLLSLPIWEACCLASRALDKVPSLQTAAKYLTELDEDTRKDKIMKAAGGRALSRYLVYLQSLQSPETAGSIRTVAGASVQVFQRSDVAAMTGSVSAFRWTDLRKKPTVVFVQIPERKTHLLKPLTALLFWQALEHISEASGLRVALFLDEFPNIGHLSGFAQTAATVRSRGISLMIGLQAVEQMEREYSKAEQDEIMANMRTKICFPGVGGPTAEFISASLGQSTTLISRTGRDMDAERKELLSPDELRRLPDRSVLTIIHNRHPLLLEQLRWYEDPVMKKLAPAS